MPPNPAKQRVGQGRKHESAQKEFEPLPKKGW